MNDTTHKAFASQGGAPPEAYLDREAWEKLVQAVRDYRPTMVILLARKMTRLWQYLERTDPGRFKVAPSISNFALDHMGPAYLAGERCAVVDDAINIGSTMETVCARLEEYGAADIHCFAVARKDHSQKSGYFSRPLTVVREQDMDESQYRSYSARISMALIMTGNPLEVEFPVYKLDVPDGINEFQRRLESQSEIAWQWVTHPLAKSAGLERVSLYPGRNVENTKIRLYFDTVNSAAFAVPMPGSFDISCGGEREAHYALFSSGMSLFEKHREKLESLGIQSGPVSVEDARLLFGPTGWHGGAQTFQSGGGFRLLPALMGNRTFMDSLGGYEHRRSLRLVFMQLFKELGRIAGADDPGSIDTDFQGLLPEEIRRRLLEDTYARLRVGFTFQELVELAARFWTGMTGSDEEKLRRTISRLLDEHIDQGYVVPILDLAMRRAFRKGEPFPNDRTLMYALGCCGAYAEPGCDSDRMLNGLHPNSRRKCLKLLAGLEEGDGR